MVKNYFPILFFLSELLILIYFTCFVSRKCLSDFLEQLKIPYIKMATIKLFINIIHQEMGCYPSSSKLTRFPGFIIKKKHHRTHDEIQTVASESFINYMSSLSTILNQHNKNVPF
ncbi:unnamed protein product [Blepharisma stoltei]|uniref:Secreted protein n=1 Tax=Blepharisma stoltei TaxID=1481888 RepID=A0AAU9ILN7_9CILI|nr:unnamed protein product [Blepharisma stoltei]